MEILFLLVPLSVVLVFVIVGMLAWALGDGQFDDLEHQGELVFEPEEMATRAAALRAARSADATAPPSEAAAPPATTQRLDLRQRGGHVDGA